MFFALYKNMYLLLLVVGATHNLKEYAVILTTSFNDII